MIQKEVPSLKRALGLWDLVFYGIVLISMAENKNVKLLKITLILFAVLTLVYGLVYLFFPETS